MNELYVSLAALGGLLLVPGMFAGLIHETGFLSETLFALLAGVLLGMALPWEGWPAPVASAASGAGAEALAGAVARDEGRSLPGMVRPHRGGSALLARIDFQGLREN